MFYGGGAQLLKTLCIMMQAKNNSYRVSHDSATFGVRKLACALGEPLGAAASCRKTERCKPPHLQGLVGRYRQSGVCFVRIFCDAQ
jgi:hypothetical protein